MTNIYVIVYVSWGLGRNGEPDRYEEIQADLGYFTTPEAAEREAEKLNKFEQQYTVYVKDFNRAREKAERAYQSAMAGWNALVDSGLDPAVYLKKPVPENPVVAMTYNEYTQNQRRGGDYYAVVEVPPADQG